jgi:hypothetical protein
MATYRQKPPTIDAAFWNGSDIAPVQEIAPEATAEGETCMVPMTMTMPGTMPVPKDNYVTKDSYGNLSYQPKDIFEAAYEEIAAG